MTWLYQLIKALSYRLSFYTAAHHNSLVISILSEYICNKHKPDGNWINTATNKMRTLKFLKENVEVTFYREWYILESNHGNHSGYNRKWTVWYEGYQECLDAERALANYINNEIGMTADDEGYDPAMVTARYDGVIFHVVSPEELIEYYDVSGSSLTKVTCVDIEVNPIQNHIL